MDPSQSIRLGDIFKQSKTDVGVARFPIVSRQVAVLWMVIRDAQDRANQSSEKRVVLLNYYFSALKELIDAFHYLDSIGFVNFLCDNGNPLPDLMESACFARLHLKKKDPSSLYSIFLKKVRDNAGFHIQLDEVEHVLNEYAGEVFPAAITAGEDHAVVELPWVASALAYISAKDHADISSLAEVARSLHLALEAVAHDLYFVNVRIALEG
jgi:hypothetical protein